MRKASSLLWRATLFSLRVGISFFNQKAPLILSLMFLFFSRLLCAVSFNVLLLAKRETWLRVLSTTYDCCQMILSFEFLKWLLRCQTAKLHKLALHMLALTFSLNYPSSFPDLSARSTSKCLVFLCFFILV